MGLLSRFRATHEKPAPGRKPATHDADGLPLCPISAPLAAAFKLRIVTAQRGGEVIGMKWRTSTSRPAPGRSPGQDENGQAHRVPLTATAVALVEAQRPTDKDGERITTQPHPDALVFVGSGDSLIDRHKKAPAAIAEALGIADMTGTTSAARRRHGWPRPASRASIFLACSITSTAGRGRPRCIERYEFDKEKRAALETWGRVLDRILEPRAGDVVSINTGRRRG